MTKFVLNFTINTSILHKFSQSHLQQSYEPTYLLPFYRRKNKRLQKSDLFIVTEQRNGTARDQSGSPDPRSNAFPLIFNPLYKNKMLCFHLLKRHWKKVQKKAQKFKNSNHQCSWHYLGEEKSDLPSDFWASRSCWSWLCSVTCSIVCLGKTNPKHISSLTGGYYYKLIGIRFLR